MTTYKSKIDNISKPIVAQITSSKYNFDFKTDTAYISQNKEFTFGHSILITNKISLQETNKPIAYNVDNDFFKNSSNGDIIQITPDGTISVLWEKRLNPNDFTLFITHQCNANCVMCPQPPKKDEYSLMDTNKKLLEYLSKEPIKMIGITGGEPTLKRNDLLELMRIAYKHYPYTHINLLTNGKKLSDFYYAKELALSNPNITFCISFPSDNIEDFNQIMNAEIYTDILKAIQNLAILRQNIELRIVILKQNHQRLLEISQFIYRNFPFVYHIVFMGMEVIGHAFENIDCINVEPSMYNNNLLNAVQFLHQRDMNVSVYNIPFCLVDKRIWRFVKNSISRWKQSYNKECNLCSKKNSCSGIFTTTKINNFKLEPILE